MSNLPACVLAFPCYANPHPGSARSIWLNPSRRLQVRVFESYKASLLANGFNQSWCHAVNLFEEGQASYFAMLHADIEPEHGWLDLLLAEMEEHSLDVVSAVVPLKDERGLTSTGLGGDDPFLPAGRLTMKQLANLPQTFSSYHLGRPDRPLLVNTGCWLARLGPWSSEVCFTVNDRIRRVDGKWVAESESEDWYFSRQAHALGLKVAATTAVRLIHHGDNEFTNVGPWGTCSADPQGDLGI